VAFIYYGDMVKGLGESYSEGKRVGDILHSQGVEESRSWRGTSVIVLGI